jgi:hypothetical protein
MTRSRFVRVGAAALAASALLVSCGGGKVDEEEAQFIGAAGGNWLVDEQPSQPGLQQRDDCGAGGDADCFINIQPVGGPSLFDEDFDVTYTSNLPTCPGSGSGRVRGEQLTLTSCFAGRYAGLNEARSDDGATRLFFDVTPDLAPGLWVEVEDGRRRFKFSDNSSGCEISASGSPAVAITLVPSQVTNPAGPFETTIGAFSIAGRDGVWTGRFVGVSGMRLVRGDDELELERRADPANGACP